MPPAPPQVFAISLKEAAASIGVSLNSVRRLAKAGRLSTTKVGRRRVVPLDALKDLVRVAAK
jgi:excisionase family DNA binding protein